MRLPDSKLDAPTQHPAAEDKPSPTQRTETLLTNLAKQRGRFTEETS